MKNGKEIADFDCLLYCYMKNKILRHKCINFNDIYMIIVVIY